MVPIDCIRYNVYNRHVNKRYGAAKRQKGNEMKLFMTKEEKLAKMEALNAKYEALSKEYRETVKKAQEIEATKGEKFSWSYKIKADQLLVEMSKIKF